ncbi:Esterase/lipase/thioesterase [Pleurotus pulmonarius]|nr:Esterase/lipase/thioesterase [Pleurotus pulmonarius]
MLKLALAFTATVLSALTLVNAHGYVQELKLGSTSYTGYLPYSDPYYNPPIPRIVRKVPGNGPVEDLSLIDVQCNGWSAGGIATAPAPLVGTVAAGSQVKFNWTQWPDSHVGPIITYMARAPSDITQWSPGNSAVWFKVAESGKTSDGKWAATDGLYANNHIYTFTIPARLRPGQYIIRHEIDNKASLCTLVSRDRVQGLASINPSELDTNMNLAWSYPGAQVYPSCSQVQVTGSGTGFPTSFVPFPGAYTGSTPGIVYDVYTNTGAYPIPGPPV